MAQIGRKVAIELGFQTEEHPIDEVQKHHPQRGERNIHIGIR